MIIASVLAPAVADEVSTVVLDADQFNAMIIGLALVLIAVTAMLVRGFGR